MWRRARPCEPHAHESYQPDQSYDPDESNAPHAYESCGPNESYESVEPNESYESVAALKQSLS